MSKAEQVIAAAEKESADYMLRTGCGAAASSAFQIGYLKRELRKAYDLLFQASHPEGCHDVTIDGITYGMQWDKGSECWLVYIGGQVVNLALPDKLLDKLADEAERIALDGRAA